MRKIIWMLVIIILLVLISVIMLEKNNPALISLNFGSKTYTAKFFNIILLFFVFVILIKFIFSIFRALFKFPVNIKDSMALKRYSKKEEAFIQSIEFYLKGDSLSLYTNLYKLFHDADFKWRIISGILLLSDISNNNDSRLEDYYGSNYRKLTNELDSLDLTESQKILVKEISSRILFNSGKILPAAVIAESVLDDIELGNDLPKSGLIDYIRVLIFYGKSSYESSHRDNINSFISKIENNIWLHKLISKKKFYNQIKKEDWVQLKLLVSNALIFLFDKSTENKIKIESWFQLAEKCCIVNDELFQAYLSFYINNNKEESNDFITKKLISYMKDHNKKGVSDLLLKFIAKSLWLTNEEKLNLFNNYFSMHTYKPSYLGLCLMGDICLDNGLIGKAKDYYDKSLSLKVSFEVFTSLANFSLLKKSEKDKKDALNYYQKAFDMLLSK